MRFTFTTKAFARRPNLIRPVDISIPVNKNMVLITSTGFHDGDMSNVIVGADGKASVEIINTAVSIDSGPNALLNKNGNTALVLHEKADDYKSQPAGNAGARLACGEIKI